MLSETELISGIKNRDKQAVQLLVLKFHTQIIKTACHIVNNMDDAEDLAQDVFIEVLESISRFKENSTLSTWIYRITVNKSLNFIRKNKRKQLVRNFGSFFGYSNTETVSVSDEPIAQHDILLENEQQQVLYRAIDSLPPNQRAVFILHKFDELPNKQIAEIMELSVASVESLMQRAKHNLQKHLIYYFAEYSNQKK
jgi:RNA polymerase sigma-70 factor (ECF subfamily)